MQFSQNSQDFFPHNSKFKSKFWCFLWTLLFLISNVFFSQHFNFKLTIWIFLIKMLTFSLLFKIGILRLNMCFTCVPSHSTSNSHIFKLTAGPWIPLGPAWPLTPGSPIGPWYPLEPGIPGCPTGPGVPLRPGAPFGPCWTDEGWNKM